ncbi:MAG: TonB-dependent receptor [Campylobacterales bacterium]|nr:TonB-dependent receptor [Campylobacterales bacterium]
MKFSNFLIALSITASTALIADDAKTIEAIKITDTVDDVSERKDSNTQKIVIDKKEIASYGVMTVSDVLGKLPGVEIKNDAPRARGMSKDSVAILIDGERQISSGSVVFGAIGRLPPDELEKVEIVRGSSAEFGGSASVTVNLVLKKASPKSYTETRVGIGLRGSELAYMLGATQNGGDKNFAWSLPISLIWATTPFESSIERQNSTAGTRTLWQYEDTKGKTDLGHHSITPKFTWKSGRDNITLSPMIFYGPTQKNSDTDISEYADPINGTGLSYAGKRNSDEQGQNLVLRARLDGEKYFADSKLSGRFALSNGKKTSDVKRDSYDASNVLTKYVENNNITDNEINTGARLDKQLGSNMLSIGAEIISLRKSAKQDYSGGYVYQNNTTASTRDFAFWVQDDYGMTESATLTGGIRLENVALKADDTSKSYSALLPSIALKWEPTEKVVIRTSLGAGMKTPKVDEIANIVTTSIAANTPAEADSKGNPDLKPEKTLNYEAIAEYYLPQNAGVLGANIYARFTKDFVEHDIQQEGVRWVDRPYNQGNAKHWGVEFDAKTKTDAIGWKDATFKMHLTLPKSEVDDSRLGVKRIAKDTPFYIFSTGIDQSIPSLKTSFNITARYFSQSKTDLPGEQSGYTKAYSLVDASLLYQISQKMKLRLTGQNIFGHKTEKYNSLTYAGNSWQTYTTDKGYTSFMLALEGRW